MDKIIITVQYQGGDAGPAVAEAIAEAKAITEAGGKSVIVDFPADTYHFYASGAQEEEYFISNTASEAEYPNGTKKKVGILLKDIKNVTLQGNHSRLLFHDVMMPIAFDHAENASLRDFQFDFSRPVVSELTVLAVGDDYMDARIQSDSCYCITDGQFAWIGAVDENGNALDNWLAMGCGESNVFQDYNPETRSVKGGAANPLNNMTYAQDLGNRMVRFHYSARPTVTAAHTYHFRNSIRREQGAFIYRSKNIVWEAVDFYSMPGLGIVSQYSENLTFTRMGFAPRLDSDRTNVSMADFMQFSGCRGEIKVEHSMFWGAQDDPINVHGTHLQVTEKLSENQIQVRFMHHQSWGFDAFAEGDTIEYVQKSTLRSIGSAVVKKAEKIDGRSILLTLDRIVPEAVEENLFVVENITWTPNVTITNCHFGCVPTRGILVTSRGKVLIANNFFERTSMSAILISDDANFWYESGPVRDVTIRDNIFYHTANPVIHILPETPSGQVHSNIRVIHNEFEADKESVIRVHGVNGFLFAHNTVKKGNCTLQYSSSENMTVMENHVKEDDDREVQVSYYIK